MYHVLDQQEKAALHGRALGEISPFDAGIPLVDVSDNVLEEIYYFRWHTYCKHIRPTPEGWVVTEFYPQVPWAGKYNTISCPAGHHLYEGRWLHDRKYLPPYARFWFTPEAQPRKYSFWAADAVYAWCMTVGDFSLAEELFEALKDNYAAWEEEKGMENGLFYQLDKRDGMEYSAGGSGCRPTINSYMYGDAVALSKIAARLGKAEEAAVWREKAAALRDKINTMLWDGDAEFYKTLAEEKDYQLTDMRELCGYVPWCFGVPDKAEKAAAWRFLNDENHFFAPYGPTTTERCCPDFMKEFAHECLWNGPSWPFATSQTVTALGNLLCEFDQAVMGRHDYFALLRRFAGCHYLTENGKTVPFIDENLDPFTGRWLARDILLANPIPKKVPGRGEDYNHSSFCDLVLTGLAGIRSRDDNVLEVRPLFTEDDLSYFCADGILYHGRKLCVLWDKDGSRYGKGAGFRIYVDGEEVFSAPGLCDFMKELN